MLNRHPQTSFEIGDLDVISNDELSKNGRVIVLDGNKEDMVSY